MMNTPVVLAILEKQLLSGINIIFQVSTILKNNNYHISIGVKHISIQIGLVCLKPNLCRLERCDYFMHCEKNMFIPSNGYRITELSLSFYII